MCIYDDAKTFYACCNAAEQNKQIDWHKTTETKFDVLISELYYVAIVNKLFSSDVLISELFQKNFFFVILHLIDLWNFINQCWFNYDAWVFMIQIIITDQIDTMKTDFLFYDYGVAIYSLCEH